MSATPNPCEHSEAICVHAAQALEPGEAATLESHLPLCAPCRQELESLQSVVAQFVAWPSDLLRSSPYLQDRLAARIDPNQAKLPHRPSDASKPVWEQVAPGIECQLLASDQVNDRVSMLVRLAPAARYPSHTHADIEELFLLDGELRIDERKLVPGDYNFGAPGATDTHVESETGCTCLLITSTRDILG